MAKRAAVEEEEKLLQVPLNGDKNLQAPKKPQEKVTWSSLPHKRQLLLLALCRLSDPLSNACLLPYLYYLVKSIISSPDDADAQQRIPRLTGLLVAAYPLGAMSTSMLWGRLSDSYGRKPIILLGLAISVVANLAFGFSRAIGTLLFWRVLSGMVNGNLSVMRSMTAEIVKERKYQTRAFLIVPLVFNSGRVAAIAVGGCLADPVDNLPWLFGPSGLFNIHQNPGGVAWTLKYPYALPAIFNGVTLSICLLLAIFGLKESLPAKENDRDFGILIGKTIAGFVKKNIFRRDTSTEYAAVQVEESEILMNDICSPVESSPLPALAPSRPPFRMIWTRHVLITLGSFALLALHNSTFLHIFPVYLSMPASDNLDRTIFSFTGGLGLASPSIGIYLATFGVCGILLQLFIYPRIQKRIGTLGCFRLANFIFPTAYLFAPYLTLLASHTIARWPAMALILFAQVMARTMAIPSTVLLLTEAVPQRNVLGTVHGAGKSLNALSSAVGPLLGGVILAKGIDIGVIGIVWWVWMCLIALLALGWSFVMKSSPPEKDHQRTNKPVDEEKG